jgi:murein DD-endopeptidase MepM/ murein hydrolase activator NlpD
MAQIPEPPIHDDDTSPSITITPVEFEEHLEAPEWGQVIGWLSLLGAVTFTIAAIIVLFLPKGTSEIVDIVESATDVQLTTEMPILEPTALTSTDIIAPVAVLDDVLPPIVDAQQFSNYLQAPLGNFALNVNYLYEPFTVINSERARSEFVEYTIVQGDTIDAIALRYGLEKETLAWCNDRRILQVLYPGDVLTIPPADGACHQVLGTREETIAVIAAQYQVDDPFTIIDSPYNFGQLPNNITPNDILLGGTNLFIPNGQGPIITWNPGRNVETDASGSVTGVTFAPGQSGSCGKVTPAGGTYWANPLSNGTWVRGFYAGHSGIDLAAPTGTPIYAANSGNVLFSGFSNWGYGNAVVIEHGNYYSTLYGHMSSIAVSCGQFVNVGQVVGYVGSTGNSSGPHLHFEIRANDSPADPTTTVGIGW